MLFNYRIILTGDCSNTNSGALNLQVTGDGSPYTITWNSPTLSTNTFSSEYNLSGLSAGTYNFNLSDSFVPTNKYFPPFPAFFSKTFPAKRNNFDVFTKSKI